ncbi:hypothetical protein AB0B89_17075 [Sphaerisporangium sp. NPDC049002]|uniref:hypothetical protein n=1 Tax=Sphaerisporangium sp. NPDC049002 TaxID=3155392 RepID=UPI0033ED8EE7
MLGLTSPVKLRRKAAVLALLTPLTLTACTSDKGPTAAQAGQTLKSHILQLLKERNAQELTITDPGGKDIACADGKAKQTFAATGNDLPERSSETLRSMLLGALNHVAPYKIVSPDGLDKPIRVSSDSFNTILVLDSSSSGVYVVSGETTCLPES